MQAPDDGVDGAQGPGGQRRPAVPVPWGPGAQGHPGSQGAAGNAMAEPVGPGPLPQGPGPDGDVAPAAAEPGDRVLDLLTLLFRCPLEADMARRSLAPDALRYLGVVHIELTVNGSSLMVHWTAEDPVLFRISINSFLDQLSLVIRNIRRMWPPSAPTRGRGKGPKV